MKKCFRVRAACGFGFMLMLVSVHTACAGLRLAGMFADNMVLQQGQSVPVWGWADPGQSIQVEFGGQVKSAVADSNGQWWVTLDVMVSSAVPRDLKISSNLKSQISNLIFHDVLVGEVWFCSGQSNMAMTMREIPAGAIETTMPQDTSLRVFTFRRQFAAAPANAITNGTWYGVDSNRVRGVSATAYYFGKRLQQELQVPVGLIVSTWGGTPVQAWMSREMLAGATGTDAIAEKGLAATRDGLKTNEAFLAAGGDPKKRPWPEWRSAATPTWLFNGMVHPFIPYAIRGVIWYQGEANVSDPELYGALFPAMIRGWRAEWGLGEFPFYFCQLPGIKLHPGEEGKLARLRAMQVKALQLPNTGMAVIYDTAEEADNHPKNKRPAGERMALLALARTYGRAIEYSGPAYAGISVDGDKVRVRFDHIGGGLVARELPRDYRPASAKPETRPLIRRSSGSPLEGFELKGADGVWHWADAGINDDTVVVSSPHVAYPVAVRYAWADFGFFNLFNKAGLPAAPFQTPVNAVQ